MSSKSKKRVKAAKERREIGKCELSDFCEKHDFDMVFINEYQIRVNDRVDIYPTGRKYCIMHWATNDGIQRWGKYNNLKELLKYIKS